MKLYHATIDNSLGKAFEQFISEKIKLQLPTLRSNVEFRMNGSSPAKDLLFTALFLELNEDKFLNEERTKEAKIQPNETHQQGKY